jgi:hypothetical protein
LISDAAVAGRSYAVNDEAAAAETGGKENFVTGGRPGQPAFAPIAIGEHGVVSGEINDVDGAAVVPFARVLEVGNAIAARREAQIAHIAADFAEYIADWIFEAILAAGFPDDGELRAVRRPVGLTYAFLDLAGRAAAERHAGKCASEQAVPNVAGIQENGELALGRDSEELGVRRTDRLRLWIFRANHENLWSVAGDGSTVDDGLFVGSESGLKDRLAAKVQLAEGQGSGMTGRERGKNERGNGDQSEKGGENPREGRAAGPTNSGSTSGDVGGGLGGTLCNPAKILPEIARRLPAIIGIFRQTEADAAFEGRGSERLKSGNGLRIFDEDGGGNAELALAGEWGLARDHFIEDGAEGKDVATGVHLFAFDLLGRHVGNSTNDGAFAGLVGPWRFLGERGAGGSDFGEGFGEAEIEKLGAGFREHDIAGLEVAVRDSAAMGLVQGAGDLGAVENDLIRRQRAIQQAKGQGFSFEVFHHDEIDIVLAADIVECADVGMIKARNGFGFAFETLTANGVVGEMSGKNFDSDEAIEAGITCLVDFAHAARAERRKDFVRT